MEPELKEVLDAAEQNFTKTGAKVEALEGEVKSLREAVENIEIKPQGYLKTRNDVKAENDVLFVKTLANVVKGAKAKGEGEINALVDLERVKTVSHDPNNPQYGAQAVAEVLSDQIIERARESYPIIGLVGRKPMTRNFREEVLVGFPSVEDGIENVAGSNIPETATQQYVEHFSRTAKVSAKPRVTDEAMYGSDLDIWGHCQKLVDDEIGRWLATQILFGSAVGNAKTMRGILSSNRLDISTIDGESWKPTFAADPADARDVDYYPTRGTGVAGGLPATDKGVVDFLIDLMSVVPTAYQANSVFIMNRNVYYALMKVRDNDNHPIFMNSYAGGSGLSLFGKQVILEDYMPDVGANAPFIIYGDLSKAFYISNGDITKFLVDPYTVDGSTVLKIDQEYFEIGGANDAIVIGLSISTVDGTALTTT